MWDSLLKLVDLERGSYQKLLELKKSRSVVSSNANNEDNFPKTNLE
jgi:hypothetical protein